MIDNELQLMHDWRYCNVISGDKKPYPNNWQNIPLTLQQVDNNNIGLQLGEHSNGVCAIDLDGEQAIDYWNTHFPDYDIDKIPTIMWSSGKKYRIQMAFSVPSKYWPVLKRKVVNTLEFRWGGQSVLPPSKLVDGRQYFWVKRPSKNHLLPIMDDVLAHWLNLIHQDLVKYDMLPKITYNHTNFDEEFVNVLLEKISTKVGNLRGDYDVWRTIAWATCSAIGMNSAKMLLTYYWPEKTNKEMNTFMSYKQGVGPTIGTLMKMSGISSMERRLLETQMRIRKMK
jgi:hypothetical protein